MKLLIHSLTSTARRWSLGMDDEFRLTHYSGCNYFSMLGSKLKHDSKRDTLCAANLVWHSFMLDLHPILGFYRYFTPCQTMLRTIAYASMLGMWVGTRIYQSLLTFEYAYILFCRFEILSGGISRIYYIKMKLSMLSCVLLSIWLCVMIVFL